jgi:hypothetical protein
MDYHELKLKTVAQLREVAQGIQGLEGSSQMRKDQLLHAICEHLKIEMHEHHEVVGVDKGSIKRRIQELKGERDAALAGRDSEAQRRARRQIHRLKRRLRRSTV